MREADPPPCDGHNQASRTRLPHIEELSLSSLENVNRVCLSFENACRAQARPRIELFLAGFEGPERDVLLHELIALDISYKTHAGVPSDVRDYLDLFPADNRIIEAVFASL